MRQREHHRRQAEDDHRLEHPHADPALDRVAGDHGRHQHRTDGGCRAQHAQPPRPGLQDVVRVDRQQRRRAAEQDSEQVQRIVPNIAGLRRTKPAPANRRQRSAAPRGHRTSSLIGPLSVPAISENIAISA